nr:cell adhesion molecule Dscam2-like [Cherax quadricarinatus]
MTSEGELHVLEVGPQDGLSKFQCRTLHQLTGSSQLSRTPARIIITDVQGSVPPRMSERAGRVVVPAGARVTLPCVAQGHPPPHYTWYKGSRALGGSSGMWMVGGSLVLGRVGVDDSAQYTCVANNTAGETRYSAHLLVTLPISVQVTPREVQVDAGGRLELRCHVSGEPVDTVTWYKDGTVLRSGGRVTIRPRETLHVSPIHASDAGIYQCAATYAQDYAHAHAYVTLGAAAPQLVYRFIEQTLQPGPAVSLKCIATGTPTPHITWLLDGFSLPPSHRYVKGQYVSAHGEVISHVNISTVHVTDGGTYACTAENSAGSVVHSARLNVYGPPHVRPMGQVSAVAGETFLVTCPVSGYPVHKITWRKDGVRLPTTHRQRVHANGTLVVEQVTRGTDDGQYSCTASTRQGLSDTQHLTVRVMVAPVVLPFHFEEKLQAGERAGAACIVSKGDPPITFTWEKDGRPVQEIGGVSVSVVSPFSNTLMINSLTAHHTGEYTCRVSNNWAEASYSAALAVNGTPTATDGRPHHAAEPWTSPPLPPRLAPFSFAVGTRAGMRAQATCLAQEGDQPLAHAWLKDGHPLDPNLDVRTSQLDAFTSILVIDRATAAHTGNYTCAATNAARTTTITARLTVSEPPWFGVRSQRHQVEVGGTASLTCEAHGDTPLALTWTRGGAPLPPIPRYEVSERQVETGQVSELVLRSSHLSDSGTYVCTATNTHGSLTADFHLLVQDVPDPPSGVTVAEEGSRHLTLTWTSPQDSNAPITAYLVTFDALQVPGGAREVTVEGEQQKVRLEGLLPATTYTLTLVAENRVGRSQPSPPLRVTTQEEPPAAAPQSVNVLPVSSTALQVSWDPPPHNLTHGDVLGYYLGFKDASEGEGGAYNFTTVGVDGVGVTSATLGGLRPHARYAVVLQAFNSKGAGPASPPALATTLEDKPSSPPGHVTCESVTSSSVVVTWAPPPPRHRNGVIVNYRVYYSQSSPHEGGGSGSVVSETQRATLAGLSPWTNYSITVAAATRAGEGAPAHALLCTTDQDVPEAPARVKAVVSGPRAVVVSWAPPARPHGRISRYTVHWEPAGGRGGPHSRRVEPHLTHLTLHDLPHTTHQVWVTASTRMGEGPTSSVAVVKPSHTGVMIYMIHESQGDDYMIHESQFPAGVWAVGGKSDGGVEGGRESGVLEQWASQSPPSPGPPQRTPIPDPHDRFRVQPDGTLTLADVQRSDSGRYTCTAVNHHGSDTVTYNLTVLVPPSAPLLHVTETTSSSIRVQWSVEDNGGAALQGATLHYRSAGGEWLRAAVDGDQRSFTARDLRCGTLHHFYLTAHNHIGTSSVSSTEAARTKGRPPEAPPQFQFVTTNSSQATLYLAQWGDGGCPITHFSVQYRRDSTTHWTTVGSEVPPSRTFAVGGLEAGGRYLLRVTAHNSAGATPAQYTVTTPAYANAGGAGAGVGGACGAVRLPAPPCGVTPGAGARCRLRPCTHPHPHHSLCLPQETSLQHAITEGTA